MVLERAAGVFRGAPAEGVAAWAVGVGTTRWRREGGDVFWPGLEEIVRLGVCSSYGEEGEKMMVRVCGSEEEEEEIMKLNFWL